MQQPCPSPMIADGSDDESVFGDTSMAGDDRRMPAHHDASGQMVSDPCRLIPEDLDMFKRFDAITKCKMHQVVDTTLDPNSLSWPPERSVPCVSSVSEGFK